MSESAPKVILVNVVGGIGAGKSTLVERATAAPEAFLAALMALPEFAWMREFPRYTTALAVAAEDTSRWIDADGEPLLPRLYADARTYAYQFQATVLTERMRAARDAVIDAQCTVPVPTHIVLLVDGAIHTDSGVFARACYDNGNMPIDRWLAYRRRYDVATRDETLWVRGGTLYLSTPLGETETRIKQRGRECEQSLPTTYIADIATRHETLLASPEYPAQPVVRIRDTPRSDKCPFVAADK